MSEITATVMKLSDYRTRKVPPGMDDSPVVGEPTDDPPLDEYIRSAGYETVDETGPKTYPHAP